MISSFRKLLIRNRVFNLDRVLEVKGLMHLLMKNRNTGEYWTDEEKKSLKKHFKNLEWTVPVLIIFFLPGGTFLLPFLAEILDRRKNVRGIKEIS